MHAHPKLAAMIITAAKQGGKLLNKDPMVSPLSSDRYSGKAVSVMVPYELLGRGCLCSISGATPSRLFFCGKEKGLFFLRGHDNIHYFENAPEATSSPISGIAISILFENQGAHNSQIEAYIFDSDSTGDLYARIPDSDSPRMYSTTGGIPPNSLRRILAFISRLPPDTILRPEGGGREMFFVKQQLVYALCPDAQPQKKAAAPHAKAES